MRGIRKLAIFYLVILLFVPSFVHIQAADTGEVPDYLEPMEVTIPIEIKLWNFDSNWIDVIETGIYSQLVQQSLYPRSNLTTDWQLNIDGNLYGLQNHIELTVSTISSEDRDSFIQFFENQTTTETVSAPGTSTQTYTGSALTGSLLDQYFVTSSTLEQYTLHMANFSFLDDSLAEQYHWFRVGATSEFSSVSQDMRNVYDLDDRALLFDPTAIAPYYNISPSIFDLSESGFRDYVVSGLNDLVEKFIVGSPQSNYFLELDNEIHIDRIVVGTDTTDLEYGRAATHGAYINFLRQVGRLFPGFDLESKKINADLDALPDLKSAIEDATQIIDGEPTVLVDFDLAETFKREIRENYYNDWPSRYYYGIFLIVDEDRRYMMNVTDGDEVTDKLVEYNVGEIGFSMDSLRDWYDEGSISLTVKKATARTLNVLGQNFGMSFLTSNFSSQIDSVMSANGISTNWEYDFSQEEVDQVIRQYAVGFGQQIRSNINDLLSSIDSSIYFWHNSSDIETLKQQVAETDKELNSGNYSGALLSYFEIIKEYETQSQEFVYTQNFVNYGSLLLVFVTLLWYYSYVLMDESISKEEFKARLRNIRDYNNDSKK